VSNIDCKRLVLGIGKLRLVFIEPRVCASCRRVEEGRLTGASQAADCFPSPLIKLDVSISNIQLSDWFHRSTHARGPHDMVPGDGTEDFLLRTATQRDRKVTVIRGVVDSSSIIALFPPSPAHQK